MMQLIYRGQTFTKQPVHCSITAVGTIQPRTFIYRGATHTCDVVVPDNLRLPRAINWRYDRPQEIPVDSFAPALCSIR